MTHTDSLVAALPKRNRSAGNGERVSVIPGGELPPLMVALAAMCQDDATPANAGRAQENLYLHAAALGHDDAEYRRRQGNGGNHHSH